MSGYDGSSLRIGDAERDTAAAALGEHFASGRLDSDEYDERVAAVWTAKVRGDLPVLFADLPGGPPESLRLGPAPSAPRARSGAAGPASGVAQGRARAVARRAGELPTWVLVVAGIVLVPTAFVVVSSALPLIVAALAVWFFLKGPGRCDAQGHHPWNRAVRR
ncbi:hypothetical protein GCM10009737_04740 [Nocardioides lentus]|uniref:DUF1707 domain-containing protein n=1 Tax=Nocardioides lentus TaxID=338077 RepID=A0ABN2NY23_9ACTN